MSIALECPQCHTPFEVDDAFAGRRGTCKQCGTKITIPGASAGAGPGPGSSAFAAPPVLAQATPEQMLAELARRQTSAVLIYSDSAPVAGEDLLASSIQPRRKLRSIKTRDLTDDHVCRLLHELAAQAKKDQAARHAAVAAASDDDLYDLKGDRLGVGLAEFKNKHHRELPGIGKTMPWCSDESPGKDVAALGAEAWHAAAGIVTCRLDFPAENNSPRIAGVETYSVLYQFLDEKLFQIEAQFNTEEFQKVHDSLKKKYGPATSETQDPRRITWQSPASKIELSFGRMRPAKPARLRFCYDKIYEQALKRVPTESDDI